jgi:hypothetical protein
LGAIDGILEALIFARSFARPAAKAELRTWCERNRNNIPEWLLDEWEIRVDANLSGST